MPADIRIHIEGDPKLLPGFRRFFNALYIQGVKIDLAMCKSNAIADFMSSVKKNPGAINVLLIDSESPLAADSYQVVRQHDHWDSKISGNITDDQLNLMVQIMESWFLADREALRSYYGQDFSENQLPANPDVEHISKEDVLSRLSAATTNTTKGKYHKTKHAPQILASIEPSKVQAIAPNCARLFNYLQSLVAQP